ncbi:hypothetical protein ACOSQ4_022278 [Xanthoceras sorbifolium]
MAPLHFFVKFVGSTFQITIVNPEKYTLHTLCCDVYLLHCRTFPERAEKFKVVINLSWTGRYVVVEDDLHLQQILDMLTARKFDKVAVEMDLLPLAIEPSLQPDDASSSYQRTPSQNTMPEVVQISDDEDTDSHEDEDYNPISSGWISEEANYSDSNEEDVEDHSNEEEAEDELSFDSDIGGEDEVLEETESDKDQMPDAASIDFDNNFMADGAADEESDSEHRSSRQMK